MIKLVKNSSTIEAKGFFDVSKSLSNIMRKSTLITQLDQIAIKKEQEMKELILQFQQNKSSSKLFKDQLQRYKKIAQLQYDIFGLIEEKKNVVKSLRIQVNQYKQQLLTHGNIQMSCEEVVSSNQNQVTLTFQIQREEKKDEPKKGKSFDHNQDQQTQSIIINCENEKQCS